MDGRILAVLVIVLAYLAVTDERGNPYRNFMSAAIDRAFDDDFDVHVIRCCGAPREDSGRRKDRRDSPDAFVTHEFPVADLVQSSSGASQSDFDGPHALIAFLQQATGRRHWRRGEIEWLERRQMLRVRQSVEIVEQIRRHLERCRTLEPTQMQFTLRVLVLPADATARPVDGRSTVISREQRERLLREWDDRSVRNRENTSMPTISSGDVLYAWTAAERTDESCYRGLTVVCRAADTRSGATLTPIPPEEDREKVDWPELTLTVGQTAVYDLPQSPRNAATRDPARALAFFTLDAVTPTVDR